MFSGGDGFVLNEEGALVVVLTDHGGFGAEAVVLRGGLLVMLFSPSQNLILHDLPYSLLAPLH